MISEVVGFHFVILAVSDEEKALMYVLSACAFVALLAYMVRQAVLWRREDAVRRALHRQEMEKLEADLASRPYFQRLVGHCLTEPMDAYSSNHPMAWKSVIRTSVAVELTPDSSAAALRSTRQWVRYLRALPSPCLPMHSMQGTGTGLTNTQQMITYHLMLTLCGGRPLKHSRIQKTGPVSMAFGTGRFDVLMQTVSGYRFPVGKRAALEDRLLHEQKPVRKERRQGAGTFAISRLSGVTTRMQLTGPAFLRSVG